MANNSVTQKHLRTFVQRGGPHPINELQYSGADSTLIQIDDISEPISGGITLNRAHDPFRIGGWITTSTTEDAPDAPTTTITWKQSTSSMAWVSYDPHCLFNVYQTIGECATPSDFDGGWSLGIKIMSNLKITDRTHAGNASFDTDDESTIAADVTVLGAVYDVGSLFIGELDGGTAEEPTVAVTYADIAACGQCGTYNDGTQWIYRAIADDSGGSTGISAKIRYSVDGGVTWSDSAVTGLGTNEQVTALRAMGTTLVLLTSAPAYYYASISPLTGVPGSWTKVSTGFVGGGVGRAITVLSPKEAYIAADNGIVYRLGTPGTPVVPMLNGSLGTPDLVDIAASGETIVAVGETGTIIKSSNRGVSWALIATPTATDVTAVEVLDPFHYWVGTDDGHLFYSLNGGATWGESLFPGSGTGEITAIKFATPEVGYVGHKTATPTAVLLSTLNGGASWSASTSANQKRVANWPIFNTINDIAVPTSGAVGVRANNVLIGGVDGGGSNGILLKGVTNVA